MLLCTVIMVAKSKGNLESCGQVGIINECFQHYSDGVVDSEQMQILSSCDVSLKVKQSRVSLRDKHSWSVSTAPGIAWSAVSQ